MTHEEYVKVMDVFSDILKNVDDDGNYIYDKISEFQDEYMRNVLNEYKASINESEAKEVIYDLLSYAVCKSQSGSSIVYVDSENLAMEVEDIIWWEIGDYLLDYEVYEEDGKWCIDCMFAGYYVPYWDGWRDE